MLGIPSGPLNNGSPVKPSSRLVISLPRRASWKRCRASLALFGAVGHGAGSVAGSAAPWRRRTAAAARESAQKDGISESSVGRRGGDLMCFRERTRMISSKEGCNEWPIVCQLIDDNTFFRRATRWSNTKVKAKAKQERAQSLFSRNRNKFETEVSNLFRFRENKKSNKQSRSKIKSKKQSQNIKTQIKMPCSGNDGEDE